MAIDARPKHAAAAPPAAEQELTLLDVLDHVLNAGLMVQGSLVISLAGVDLIYLGLHAVVTSVETALARAGARQLPRRTK